MHRLKLLPILALLLASLPLLSCGQTGKKLDAPAFNHSLVNAPAAQLIDVRTPEEYLEGHLPNAVNIDYNSPHFEQATQGLDKSRPVYVYCLSGGRSSEAASYLRSHGFAEVNELKGGILAWKNSKLPLTQENPQARKDSFDRSSYDHIVNGNKVVLVDFFAEWCPPCKQMQPSIEKLTTTYEGKAVIFRQDLGKTQAVINELNVTDVPLLRLYKDGKIIRELKGYQDEAAIRALIDAAL